MKLLILMKLVSVLVLLTISLVLWIIADSDAYYPGIIAPFTQIHALILGVAAILVNFKHSNKKL